MRRIAVRSSIVVLLSAAAAAPALAHRAPSPTENNRYAKVTLLPDTVRIAYTVFFGDRPGLIERRRIDANGDGLLDENEAKTFSTRLHAEIVPLIDVKIDGAPPGAPWRVADLGLGTPTTQAGAFALD